MTRHHPSSCRPVRAGLFLSLCLLLPCIRVRAQSLPLPELRALSAAGAHPGDAKYYSPVIYANAVFPGDGDDVSWNEFEGNDAFGGEVLRTFQNPRFDANGYPLTLAAGKKLGIIPWGLNTGYQNRPASWPSLVQAALGKWVVTWTGRADIQASGGSPVFLAAESSAPAGLVTNGRRVYLCPTEASLPNKFILHALDPALPPTEIKIWLPDPANPAAQSLERPGLSKAARLFHPAFIARLKDRPWSCIRMMDLGLTNNSPVQDWTDRRPADHVFPTGVLNPRDPTENLGGFIMGDRLTGVPYEHMVALCNETDRNLWINVPHLATPAFAAKLAQLIQCGSDGIEPYTTPQAAPVWPPLKPGLKVFVEYSNEVWNSGIFAQGAWAFAKAGTLGQTREQLIAARASAAWQQMEAVLGSGRVIRVGAVQTGSEGYSRELLTQWRDNASLLQPEIMAVTTYFGHNMQYFAQAQGYFNGRAGSDPYWDSPALAHHQQLVFDRWEAHLFAGTAEPDPTNAGDNVADQGGIPDSIVRLGQEFTLPMLAYEGGPNFSTTSIDSNPGAAPGQSAVTIFMEALQRHPRFSSLMQTHLELARSKGLWMHMPFTLASSWGRFGQWGHLESMDQPPASSVKYQSLLGWVDEQATLRHPADVTGTAPFYTSPTNLTLGRVGHAYSTTLTSAGGEGPRTWKIIAFHLPAGLTFDPVTRTITGTPLEAGVGSIFTRIHDADGDPAWRAFTLRVVAPGSVFDVAPVADAGVVQFSGLADTNLGFLDSMQLANPLFDSFFTNPPNPANAEGAKAYLKFDLAAVVSAGVSLSEATLGLHATNSGTAPAAAVIYETSNAWSESGITFNSRPPGILTGPATFGQAPPGLATVTITAGAPAFIPLTSHVQNRATIAAPKLSFIVAGAAFATLPRLASRENADPARHPRLRLTVAGPPPAPTAPDFTHISTHAGELYLTWPARPGLRLQSSNSLASGDWTDVPGTISATAYGMSLTGPRRFLRLHQP